MKVKRSSSPTCASASASASGLAAANSRPRARSSSRSAKVEHVGERDVRDLRPLRLVLDQHADCVRVLEHVAAVLRRAVRVDRRPDRTDPRQRVVEERPLEARLGEDPERVALAHAQREQAVGELLDRQAGLVPRDLLPAAGALDEVGGPGAARADRLAPELSDRAHGAQLTPEGKRSAAANLRGPTTLIHSEKGLRCELPGTDHSASAWSPSRSASRPRRRRRPVPPTSPSGRCTASARRRSSRSAGARCTSARCRTTSSSRAGRSRRASS